MLHQTHGADMRPTDAPVRALAVRTVLAVCLLAAPVAQARWQIIHETPDGVESEIEVAIVRNPSGHSLRVFRDDDGWVQAVFTIRAGFDALAGNGCPSYQVDSDPPVLVSNGDSACVLDPKRAGFSLGKVDERSIRSNTLLDLMNGTRIHFRYRLPALGYRETTFNLKRSKQVLNKAIGSGIAVVAE